jgi:Tol biopolymer transport system component
MRAFAVCLLTIGVLGVLGLHAAESNAAKRGCNGLLAFTSNRSEDALGEIYRIGLDGTRTDVSRSIGADFGPAPSPDGSKLAFWSINGLLVADADGQNQRPIVVHGGAGYDAGAIAWSPDSRFLAFSGYAVSRVTDVQLVFVYDTQTGVATDPAEGTAPHWSPDGSLLEYQSSGANGVQQVFVVSPDGTGRTEIAEGVFVAWSPDGTRILGIHGADSWVAPVGGGASVTIPAFTGQAWMHDSRRIVGFQGETVESVAADGTDLEVIATSVVFDSLSPDGHRLAVVEPPGHVLVTDLLGNTLRDLGSWAGQPLQTVFRPFAWSPDSIHLVLWSGGTVIVADTSTGATQTLAGSSAEATGQPVWSPDGTAIYDSLTDISGNTDLYLANPDGTGVRRIVKDAVPDVHPLWSPNGKQIAFLRLVSPATLVVTDTAGQTRTLLRDPGLAEPAQTALLQLAQTGLGPPAWSPDGRTIAVATTTNAGLDFIDVRTGKQRMVGETEDAYPTFSPDGRSIAYATPNLTGGENVVVARLNRRGDRSWSVHAGEVYSPDDAEPGLVEDIRWSPDGKDLSFIRFAVGEYGDFGYSTRILDTRIHRLVAKSSLIFENSAYSPDGRFVAIPGFDTWIDHRNGKNVAKLKGLRSVDVSWQPLCKPRL